MNDETPREAECSTRRQWLRTMARSGALLGLLGGVGLLSARRECRQAACAGCPLLARCDLPRAVEAQRAEGRS